MKLIFRDDVSLQSDPDANVTLQWQAGARSAERTFGSLTPGILTALQSLVGSGVALQELADTVIKEDGLPALYRFYAYLQTLENASLVHRFVPNGRGPLVTLIPNSPHFKFRQQAVDPEQKYILSRFAYWRRIDNYIVLESPLGLAKLRWHDRQALALIYELQQPYSLAEIASRLPTTIREKAELIFVFLLNAELLATVDEDGHCDEDTIETLRQWEFHDLLFHTRSRNGRTLKPHGGTSRFLGQIPPLPAIKPPMSDEFIALHTPDMENLTANDIPLALAMENRRSIRAYNDEAPITARQVGEFLYRVARVREVYTREKIKKGRLEKVELSRRPYPGGGAQYELEFYLAVRHCRDIAPGFYHYCPGQHQLYQVRSWNDRVAELLKMGTPIPDGPPPQILITIAARFQRVTWKYESMAYALMLKNCGVLHQSMYLVATAMGLAACALGGGDSDLFAQIAGTDYYAETSVGEFALGSAH